MQYISNEESRKQLMETLSALNKLDVHGLDNLGIVIGSIQRIQKVLESMIQKPEVIIKQSDNNNQNPNIVP